MTDKTKQRIRELVPEVMELKFGCEVVFNEYAKHEHGFYLRGVEFLTEKNKSIVRYSDYEILSSPITLAVVLRAIEKAGLNDQVQYHEILFRLIVSNKRLWNLTKDNYDYQSEETKLFIAKLLGV